MAIRYNRLITGLRILAGLCMLAGLGIAAATVLGSLSRVPSAMNVQASVPMFAFLTLSVVVVFALRGPAGFLIGIFTFLIGWRVSALSGLGDVTLVLLAAFVAFLLWFGTMARSAAGTGLEFVPGHSLTGADIHLTCFRLYLGLDLVPHFTEKLFAGPAARGDDVEAFTQLGVPDPLGFVILAGIVELAGSLGVGLGIFTRLAAVCLAAYLMIATVMGDHFSLGFIWASPGGGWEYPVLWTVLVLTFAIGGGHWLSLDEVIRRNIKVPAVLSVLMSGRARS